MNSPQKTVWPAITSGVKCCRQWAGRKGKVWGATNRASPLPSRRVNTHCPCDWFSSRSMRGSCSLNNGLRVSSQASLRAKGSGLGSKGSSYELSPSDNYKDAVRKAMFARFTEMEWTKRRTCSELWKCKSIPSMWKKVFFFRISCNSLAEESETCSSRTTRLFDPSLWLHQAPDYSTHNSLTLHQ